MMPAGTTSRQRDSEWDTIVKDGRVSTTIAVVGFFWNPGAREMELNIEGSCLCRSVRFAVRGLVNEFYTCYCSRCRKETGSAFATNMFVPLDAVVWISGEDRLKRFELPNTSYFCLDFCTQCGSTVPYLSRNRQGYIIPVGTLDGDPGVQPTHQIYWADRAPWFDAAMQCTKREGST